MLSRTMVQVNSPEYFMPPQSVATVRMSGSFLYWLRIVTWPSVIYSKNSFAKVRKCISNDIFSQEVNHHTPSRAVEHYSFSRFFHIRREVTCKIMAFFRLLDEVSSLNLKNTKTKINTDIFFS